MGEVEEPEQIAVTVGRRGMQTQKRFAGVRLASWDVDSGKDKDACTEIWTGFRTARDKLAVHYRRSVDWWRWSWRESYNVAFQEHPEDPDALLNEKSEASLDVYDSLDELRPEVPKEFFVRVEHYWNTPAVEVLDI